jgi:hypothetical protein
MKKAELKKIINEYNTLKSAKGNPQNNSKTSERFKELERRYFHETGEELSSKKQN